MGKLSLGIKYEAWHVSPLCSYNIQILAHAQTVHQALLSPHREPGYEARSVGPVDTQIFSSLQTHMKISRRFHFPSGSGRGDLKHHMAVLVEGGNSLAFFKAQLLSSGVEFIWRYK